MAREVGPTIAEDKDDLLSEYVKEYLLTRLTSSKYAHAFSSVIISFGRFLGRAPRLSDLTDRRLNQYLAYLTSQELSKWTVRGARAKLIALWRHAFEQELLDILPRRVVKIRPDMRVVEAWGEEQIKRLLFAAGCQQGRFKNKWRIPRSDFARGIILTGYETAARLGDVMAFRLSDIAEDGSISWIQHKTQIPQSAVLSRETIDLIRKIANPDRTFIFGGCVDRRYFLRWMKSLIESAGLKGTFKYLRRSSGSLVERDHPGWGHKVLGNKPEIFRKHYEAPRLTASHLTRPRPPSLNDLFSNS